MVWKIKLGNVASKQLKKLSWPAQRRILDYLEEKIEGCENPKAFGESLVDNKSGLWRYRVGDYRIICKIIDDEFIVLTLSVGHRKDIYR